MSCFGWYHHPTHETENVLAQNLVINGEQLPNIIL